MKAALGLAKSMRIRGRSYYRMNITLCSISVSRSELYRRLGGFEEMVYNTVVTTISLFSSMLLEHTRNPQPLIPHHQPVPHPPASLTPSSSPPMPLLRSTTNRRIIRQHPRLSTSPRYSISPSRKLPLLHSASTRALPIPEMRRVTCPA